MAQIAMWTRDTKSNRRPVDETENPLTWVGLILAALLALVLVIETTPAIRGPAASGPTELTAD